MLATNLSDGCGGHDVGVKMLSNGHLNTDSGQQSECTCAVVVRSSETSEQTDLGKGLTTTKASHNHRSPRPLMLTFTITFMGPPGAGGEKMALQIPTAERTRGT